MCHGTSLHCERIRLVDLVFYHEMRNFAVKSQPKDGFDWKRIDESLNIDV